MRNWDKLFEKIDNMTVEELERLMRAALDRSECTKDWSIEKGFEALRQFIANGGFEAPQFEED